MTPFLLLYRSKPKNRPVCFWSLSCGGQKEAFPFRSGPSHPLAFNRPHSSYTNDLSLVTWYATEVIQRVRESKSKGQVSQYGLTKDHKVLSRVNNVFCWELKLFYINISKIPGSRKHMHPDAGCNTYPLWKLESGWGSVPVQQWLGKSSPLGTDNLGSLWK